MDNQHDLFRKYEVSVGGEPRSGSLDDKIDQARQILDEAIEVHDPVAVYVGMSGGHDSLTVTHLVMNHLPNARVLHINTGIGIEKTRQFVRDTCEEFGWPLEERVTPESYEELVLEHGFPGPPMHMKMYSRLKERVVYDVCRDVKEHRLDRVMFITGVRASESQARSGYQRVMHKVKSQVWVNPIYYFKGNDKTAYLNRHDLPRNEVVETLGMSGECLCGAYAHKGEKELVRLVDPATAEYIDDLEERVNARGFPWLWEHRPPKSYLLEKHGQQNAFQPLCVGCEKVHRDNPN